MRNIFNDRLKFYARYASDPWHIKLYIRENNQVHNNCFLMLYNSSSFCIGFVNMIKITSKKQ